MPTAANAPAPASKPSRDRLIEWALTIGFIAVIAAANISVAIWGPWVLPITAFFLVGMMLVIRDFLHDVWHARPGGVWPRMLAMFAVAGSVGYLFDSSAGRIAIASISALVGSSLLETYVFQRVFAKKWMIRSNVTNGIGAIADGFIFPVVAFGVAGVGGWLPLLALVATQGATKAIGGVFWTTVFRFTLNPDLRRERREARRLATARATA